MRSAETPSCTQRSRFAKFEVRRRRAQNALRIGSRAFVQYTVPNGMQDVLVYDFVFDCSLSVSDGEAALSHHFNKILIRRL
jgi:hypothetical protein